MLPSEKAVQIVQRWQIGIFLFSVRALIKAKLKDVDLLSACLLVHEMYMLKLSTDVIL